MAEKDEKDLLVPVGPGADSEDVREESEERAEGGEVADDEQAESEDEERLGQGGEEDDDRAEIRRRRKAEKQRKKENRNRDRLELNYLRNRNEALERRQSELDARVANGEMVMIDNKIAELDGQIREADKLKALAISKSDGESAAEADRISQDLRAGRNHLQGLKNQRTVAARTAAQPQVDPMIQARAREWAESHDWYDTNLRNPDSRVAKAIEDSLFNEGTLDARTPEYWKELDKRLKKYMPHRYGNGHRNLRDEDEDRDEREEEGADENEEREEREERTERRPRGPQVRVGGRERPLRKNEVYVSAERREAMITAGVWDDPVLRDRYLKQYQKYDRESRRR